MKDLFLWIILLIAIAGLLTLATARSDDARANRLYARAHLVDAQSSARQDTLAGMMPYAILGLGYIGFAVVTVAIVIGVVAVVAIISNRPSRAEQIGIIERQIIIVLQPGQIKPDAYRLLPSIINGRQNVEQAEAQKTVVYGQKEIR